MLTVNGTDVAGAGPLTAIVYVPAVVSRSKSIA